MPKGSLVGRWCRLTLAVSCVLVFSNVILPALTRSCDRLSRMAAALEDSGIDPSRYYYTDVPAVGDAIHNIDNALRFAPTGQQPPTR